jgi:hypothetical protein
MDVSMKIEILRPQMLPHNLRNRSTAMPIERWSPLHRFVLLGISAANNEKVLTRNEPVELLKPMDLKDILIRNKAPKRELVTMPSFER